MAVKTIHNPVTLVPSNIYLIPFISCSLFFSLFLKTCIPITKNTNAIIITRVFRERHNCNRLE